MNEAAPSTAPSVPSAAAQRDVRYLVPGPMHLTDLGSRELDRREQKLQDWALPGTRVTVKAVDAGPASIESMYEEYLSIPAMAQLAVNAQQDGAHAAIIGCFGDPGLDGLREVTDMLVVGPAAASIAMATTLGHRFGIVTVTDSIIPALRRLTWEAGALDSLASIRSIKTSVIDLNKDHDAGVHKMMEEGRRSVEDDGADTLILGCMSMGFLDVAEQMTESLGVPVINPSRVALHMAEATLALGLTHSRRAFMEPPKITAGKHLSELYLQGERL
ncbi:aspartate/glutamate racemase family protein [Ornithinimicrobium sediminis]|uniref:aspartate/glutamate racemase family protein n=1 Tax=Ornithinimicrobium sediminis TaxID=2904603 RepID=UPI001E530A56|nr:aspartate/glutamate racemase family protein [Ornithinimicrobium sediminis]MCE0485466.1 aspartate/glutamate racemase family protein [Ornithinimicrobium sediminis]